jgi:hypothetical protein
MGSKKHVLDDEFQTNIFYLCHQSKGPTSYASSLMELSTARVQPVPNNKSPLITIYALGLCWKNEYSSSRNHAVSG